MKKILIYLIVFTIALLGQSCQHFLDEDLSGKLGVSNFFQGSADAEAAVAGVYEELEQIYERRIFLMSALPADDMKNGVGMGNGDLKNLEFARITAENSWPGQIWQRHYSGIARANFTITNISDIDMDIDLRNRLIGEAKFLRALFYFNLVRWFGAIPLTTIPVTSLEESKISQAPVSEIYAQIIQDLEDAEVALPLPGEYAVQGRATEGAAKVLLGKVYLTMGQFQNAADKLAEVIDNESTYGYGLHDDYGDNWEIDAELGQEMIFTIEFMQSPGRGNIEMRLSSPRSAIENTEAVLGWTRRGDEADIPTMDLYSQFDPNDERRDETLTYEFVSLNDGSIHIASIPLFVKYFEDGEAANNESDANMHVLRYSDALLMYAEALNEIGQTADAIPHLNRVIERAFNDTAHNYAGSTQDDFRDRVLLERRLEFACEGHRWFDLVRTGRYIATMQSHSILEESLSGESERLDIGENIMGHMVLMPIPQGEINANSLLNQNEGY